MKEIKCPKCGKEYILNRHRLPVKDEDCVLCKCGEILHSWRKESAMYTLEEKKK